MLILEELETARRRGARIYAELVGYGMSADAYHITAPSEDGDGAFRVDAHGASRSAGIEPPSRSTTSTRTARRRRTATRLETLAIKRCFGDHAQQAGGVVDQVDDRAPARRRRRPRGRHHRARRAPPDRAADDQPRRARSGVRSRLRARTQARPLPIEYALSNSFGFGGTNAALLFKRYEGELPDCRLQIADRG